MRRVGTRTLVVIGLLVTLALAGVGSLFASGSPDGLQRVAEQTGMSPTERQHAAAGSPLSDYAVRGVGDGRLSGGLAGVIGVVVVGGLAGGLVWVVRRRGARE
jgi:PDGLE domain